MRYMLLVILLAFGLGGCSSLQAGDEVAGLAPDREASFAKGTSVSMVGGTPVGATGTDLVRLQLTGNQDVGSQEHPVVHKGVQYWFVSAENAATFSDNPEQFLPEFDGMCAWGMVDNPGTHPSIAVNAPHTTPSSRQQYVVLEGEDGRPITVGFYSAKVKERFMQDPTTSLKAARQGYVSLNGRIVPWDDVAEEVAALKEKQNQ